MLAAQSAFPSGPLPGIQKDLTNKIGNDPKNSNIFG
jgi:hypothetical protein